MFFVLLRLFTYERTNERMNVWMDSPCSIAMTCPCLSACVHVFDWVLSLLFYCCCCWCCRLWVLFFVSFPFYFRFSRDYRVGRVSLQNTHTHTQNHIYTKWMHTWPHTHSYISLLFPYFLATLENIQSFYATLSPFRCSFSLFVFLAFKKD